jgi:broad specificity phosphatase PhoE
MNRIIVMRHGESENNVVDILSSSIDHTFHLTERGRQQVSDKAAKLKETEQIALIISSPLIRAYETAEIVAKQLGILTDSIRVDSRLREPFFGKVEGKTCREYLALAGNGSDPFDLAVVNGESGPVIIQRVNELLKEIASEKIFSGKTILLVTHSFTLCQILKIRGLDQKRLPSQAEYFTFELNE